MSVPAALQVDAYKDYLYIAMHVWQLEPIPQHTSDGVHGDTSDTGSDTDGDTDGDTEGPHDLGRPSGSAHRRYHSQQRQQQRAKGAKVQSKMRHMKRKAAGLWHHLRHQDAFRECVGCLE